MKLLPSGPPLGANVGAVNAGLVVDQLAVVLKFSVKVTAGTAELAKDFEEPDTANAATRHAARSESRFIGTLPFFRVVDSMMGATKMLLRFKINRYENKATMVFSQVGLSKKVIGLNCGQKAANCSEFLAPGRGQRP